MAVVSIQLLILLDPRNSHCCYVNKIGPRIFRHCSNGQECRVHIRSQADSSKWDKHLFLPDFETELAEHAIPGLSDTLFYLYCHGQNSVDENKQKFQARALNRIFTVDELPFYLYGAGIELLHKLLRNKPDGINEREYHDLVLIAKGQLDDLNKIFNQFMSEKLGEQPSH